LGDPAAVAAQLARASSPDAASGGADAEALTHAEGRAVQMLTAPTRAVTLGDCEALALATPGTALTRAAARANHCPGFECYSAPGFLTVVIVPSLPAGRPVPSTGLLGAVSRYLNRRRVAGTRIVVSGPDYLEVAVNAQVTAVAGQNKSAVQGAVVTALAGFLDPLTGGPDGAGWPLGRDVIVSEVLDVIARVPGVDHVDSLSFTVPDCGTQCGNVCLRPLALAVSGNHQIEVS